MVDIFGALTSKAHSGTLRHIACFAAVQQQTYDADREHDLVLSLAKHAVAHKGTLPALLQYGSKGACQAQHETLMVNMD